MSYSTGNGLILTSSVRMRHDESVTGFFTTDFDLFPSISAKLFYLKKSTQEPRSSTQDLVPPDTKPFQSSEKLKAQPIFLRFLQTPTASNHINKLKAVTENLMVAFILYSTSFLFF